MYEEKKVGKIRFFDAVRCNDRDDAQDEEELDIATEEMDVEDFGIAECAGEDGIAAF